MLSSDRIEVWIRARDARRFQAEMARSAASVREVGAAGAGTGRKLGAAGRGMAILTKSLKIGAVAVVGIAAEATKLGVNFDRAMELIHTQSGASQAEVKLLSGQVLNLAKVSSQGPVELANALYRIEGAGLRGKDAMDALTAASQLAAVGNANVEDTAKTLSQTWFVGIKGAGTYNDTVAELNATVGAGDLRMQQLVDALGVGVLPAAKQAGLSLQDVTGAMAVFGDETNNVSGFMAQFATALHFLYNPSSKAEKSLNGIGLSGLQMAKDMRKPQGMLTALRDLRDHLDKLPGGHKGIAATQVLGNIFPGGRGRVMLVLLNQLDRYKQKMDQIAGTHKNFGEAVQRTAEQPLVRLKTAWSNVEVSLIQFYNVIKPVIIPVLVALAQGLAGVIGWLSRTGQHVKDVINWWNGLPGPVKLAAEALGIFIAQGMALYALVRIFAAVKAVILFVRTSVMALRGALILLQLGSGPLMLALMGLVTVAVLIVTHWKWTKRALGAVWNWLKGAAGTVFGWIGWAARHGLLGPVGYIITHWNSVVKFFKKMPGRLAGVFSGMWDGIKDAFRSAINWILSKWNNLSFGIPKTDLGPLGTFGGIQINTPDIPLLASGGTISNGGLGIVGDAGPELASVGSHGTTITPLSRGKGSSGLAGAFRFHFEIPVVVRGREIARATADEVSDWDARRGR